MKSTGKIRNPKVIETIKPTISNKALFQLDEYGSTHISKDTINSLHQRVIPSSGFTLTNNLYQAKVEFTKEYREALAIEIEKETSKQKADLECRLDNFIEMRLGQVINGLTNKIIELQMEVERLKQGPFANVVYGKDLIGIATPDVTNTGVGIVANTGLPKDFYWSNSSTGYSKIF